MGGARAAARHSSKRAEVGILQRAPPQTLARQRSRAAGTGGAAVSRAASRQVAAGQGHNGVVLILSAAQGGSEGSAGREGPLPSAARVGPSAS